MIKPKNGPRAVTAPPHAIPVLSPLLCCFLSCALSLPAEAQELFHLHRLNSPISLDGRPNEAVWQEVAPLPVAMQMPHYKKRPSQPTEIRVTYDDQYLYLGARCYDDPAEVFGVSYKRDFFTRGTD